MTCDDCRDKLTDLLEGDLSPEQERELRAHLAGCAECARALAQMQALVAALHGLPEVEPPAGLRERLREIPEASAPAQAGAWRRVRYVVATVAAAAAALLLVWTGVTHFGGDATAPLGTPEQMLSERIPERPAAPVGIAPEAGAPEDETMVAEEAAVGSEVASGAEEAEVAPAETELAEAPAPASTGDDAAGARATRDRAPRRPERRQRGAVRGDASEPAAPPPAPIPMGVHPAAPAADEATEVEPPEGRSMSGGGGAFAGAPGLAGPQGPVGPTGPAGPVGPGMRIMAIEGADELTEGIAAETPLTLPVPKYLDAGGSTTATTGTGEGSPFVVSVMPPQQRVVGTIAPATIAVETEQDVARAKITLTASPDLDLINIDEDGTLFDGPLIAGQRTVLSVRMLARAPGEQSITMRLRSTDPIVDTRLQVRMGEFVAPLPPEQRTVSFDFTDTPMREAVAEVVRQSGLRVVVDQAVADRAVTIASPDPIPAGAALRAIAAAADCAVREVEGVLIVEPMEE